MTGTATLPAATEAELLDAGLLAGICRAYGFDKCEDLGRFVGGQSYPSHHLRADGHDYVLTLFDAAEPAAQLALVLAHLAAHGFRTSKLVAARDGRTVHPAGSDFCLLKVHLAGREMRRPEATALRGLGGQLARLHAIAPPEGLPDRHAYGVEAFGEIADAGGDGFPAWLAARAKRLAAVARADLPRGLVHADAFPDNVLVADGRIAALIDFEQACVLPFAFDLGMAIAGLATLPGAAGRHVEALLAGYGEGWTLGEAETEALPALVDYAATATAFWRYREWELRKPGTARAGSYRQMAAIADAVEAKGLGFLDG